MRRGVAIIILSLLCISLVYAAGYSTGSVQPKKDPTPIPSSSAMDEDKTSCEVLTTTKSRVKCRLEQGSDDNVIPEPCRALSQAASQNACISLYKQVYPCYEKIPTEKDECMKQVAGFQSITVAQEAKIIGAQQHIHDYVLFLLYDLQEIVEDKYDDKELTSDQAATLITQIVKAKEAIVLNKPKATVQAEIITLKQQWQEYLG